MAWRSFLHHPLTALAQPFPDTKVRLLDSAGMSGQETGLLCVWIMNSARSCDGCTNGEAGSWGPQKGCAVATAQSHALNVTLRHAIHGANTPTHSFATLLWDTVSGLKSPSPSGGPPKGCGMGRFLAPCLPAFLPSFLSSDLGKQKTITILETKDTSTKTALRRKVCCCQYLCLKGYSFVNCALWNSPVRPFSTAEGHES